MLGISNKQVELVQRSWHLVQMRSDNFVQIFYDKLFDINPQLRDFFSHSIEAQSVKLMGMFSTVVEALDDSEVVIPCLAEAGYRHAGYGVEAYHYEQMLQAWLSTLAEVLRDDYTLEQCEAWSVTLRFVGTVMRAHTGVAKSVS